MSDAPFSRRSALSLVAVTFFLSGCASMINHRTVPGPPRGQLVSNPCVGGGTGSKDPYKPIICVDDTNPGAPTAPDSTFYDVEADLVGATKQPSNRPVKVQWFTTSGSGNLAVDFDAANKGCVGKVSCNGNGFCFTMALKQSASKQCAYGVNLDGRQTDPIVVVNPCCD